MTLISHSLWLSSIPFFGKTMSSLSSWMTPSYHSACVSFVPRSHLLWYHQLSSISRVCASVLALILLHCDPLGAPGLLGFLSPCVPEVSTEQAVVMLTAWVNGSVGGLNISCRASWVVCPVFAFRGLRTQLIYLGRCWLGQSPSV